MRRAIGVKPKTTTRRVDGRVAEPHALFKLRNGQINKFDNKLIVNGEFQFEHQCLPTKCERFGCSPLVDE